MTGPAQEQGLGEDLYGFRVGQWVEMRPDWIDEITGHRMRGRVMGRTSGEGRLLIEVTSRKGKRLEVAVLPREIRPFPHAPAPAQEGNP